MRRTPLLCSLTLLAACRCGGGDGDPSGALYTILSEGAGPASTAPLWPLRVGMRLVLNEGGSAANEIVQFIDGTTTIRGEPVYRLQSAGGTTWLGIGTAGVFRYGDSIGGRFDHPALVVPATVRVGMAWEVDVDGDGTADHAFEVTAAAPDEPTPWGPATVWTIVEGGQVHRRYAEGFGFVGTAQLQLVSGILPDEDQPAIEAPDDALPLTRIGRAPFRENFEVHALSAVPSGRLLTITAAGYQVANTALFNYPRRVHGLCFGVGWDAGTIGVLAHDATNVQGVATFSANRCPIRQDDNGELPVGHASAALVDGGAASWAERTPFGAVTTTLTDNYHTPFLLYRHPSDGPRVQKVSTFRESHHRSQVERLDGTEVSSTWEDHLVGLPPYLDYPRYATFTGLRTLHPPVAGDDGFPVVVQTPSGLLAHGWMPLDRPPEGFRSAGFLGGRLAVRTTETERELLVTSFDGAVDRLVIEDDGFRRERVASVAVPPGHQLMGALRLVHADGEHLVLATYDGWRMLPSFNDIRLTGDLHLWSTPLPDRDPWPVALPASLGVSVAAAHHDAVVCWTEEGAPLEREGWHLGGAPVAGVVAAGPGCAVLIRDLAAADDPATPGGYRISGPIPGVGRVRTASPAAEDLARTWDMRMRHQVQFAPLQGGGATNMSYALDPGGLTRGTPGTTRDFDLWIEGSERLVGGVVPDAAGHGLWFGVANGVGSLLYLAGPEPVEVAFSRPHRLVGWVEGGGVLLQTTLHTTTTSWEVAPDGTTTDLGTLPYLAMARRADGTLCGTDMTSLTCEGPTGGLRSAELDLLPVDPGDLRFLPDGPLVLSVDDGTWLVDPDDLEATLLDERPLEHLTWAADGTLWGVLTDGSAVVEVTGDGLIEVPVPDLDAPHAGPRRGLLVDEEVVVLVVEHLLSSQAPVPIRMLRP